MPGEEKSEESELEAARVEARAAQERLAALEERSDGGSADAVGPGESTPTSRDPDQRARAGGASSAWEGEPAPTGAPGRRWLATGAIFVTLFVLALWHVGTFDHGLVDWGLNAKDCARNDFGAVYCGEELSREQSRTNEQNVRRYEQDAKEFGRESNAWRSCARSVGYQGTEAVCGPAPEPPSLGSP